MKRYAALLVALAALVVAVFAGATAGRVPVVNRVAVTRMTSIGNLPGLVWWIEPDGITAADTTNVDSWTDKSGNGLTISEVGSNRPTVASSVLSGFNGATFVSGSSQRLARTNTQAITKVAFSFGLVIRVNANVSDDVYFSNAVAGTNGFEFSRNSSGSLYNVSLAGDSAQNANAITTGGFHTVTYHQSGFSNGTFRYDRVQQSLAAALGFIVPGATASLILGSRANNALPASITVVAGFLCNGDLPSTDIQFAENAWKAKYPGLP